MQIIEGRKSFKIGHFRLYFAFKEGKVNECKLNVAGNDPDVNQMEEAIVRANSTSFATTVCEKLDL